MSETVIVFGGSGFIGTHLTRRLLRDGGVDVISVDLRPPRETLTGVDYRLGDVRNLSAFDSSSPVTRIYNLAAVHTTPGHPASEYYETNVLGAVEVTLLAQRLGVPEIVFTSSISVYGPSEDTKTEETPPAPTSAYGWSKLLAERVHRQWQESGSARRLVIARPAVVFGPGEGGNFTRLAKLIKAGFFVYPGRKDTIKACIYVEDLVDAIEFARVQPQAFTLFNATYPQRYTLEKIVGTLIDNHFPKARTVLFPRAIVLAAVRLLVVLDAFHIGLHPDRVMKLVRSTDVYPGWLVSRGRDYPKAIESAFRRWADASGASFT